MAFVLNDRVKETSTTTGTGSIALSGTLSGFETFASGIGNSNTTYYAIAHQTANEFEVGFGTLDGSSANIARTSIISSSNSDAAVNFSAGTKDVFCTLPSSKISLPSPKEYGSSSNPIIITTKVGTKTAAHPYSGQGSSSAYFLNGLESPAIQFAGNDSSYKYYYRFDQSHSSNSGHPLRFYLEAAKTTAYTTGAYTQIAVDSETPNTLYYQCSSHGYMGNYSSAITNKVNSNLSTMGELSVGTLFKMPTNTANKMLIADGTSFQEVDMSGDATIASGGALTLANSGVSAASYTATNLTVDAKGRITSASSGAAGVSAGFVIAMSVAL